MKDLNVVIVGGASGLGRLLAEMAVEYGAAGLGIVDLSAQDAQDALAPARAAGSRTASAAPSPVSCGGLPPLSAARQFAE